VRLQVRSIYSVLILICWGEDFYVFLGYRNYVINYISGGRRKIGSTPGITTINTKHQVMDPYWYHRFMGPGINVLENQLNKKVYGVIQKGKKVAFSVQGGCSTGMATFNFLFFSHFIFLFGAFWCSPGDVE